MLPDRSTRAGNGSRVTLLMNAESLAPPLTGIGNYTLQLLSHLAGQAPWLERIGFQHGKLHTAEALLRRQRSFEVADIRVRERRMGMLHWLADRTHLPYAFHQWRNRLHFKRCARNLQGLRLYHEPNYVLKPFDGPAVVTVHDLSVFRYPEYHPSSRVRHLESGLVRSLERADRVITDSPLVSTELVEMFGTAPERIESIPLGVSEVFQPLGRTDCLEVLRRHGLEYDRYLLCVSTFEPRKNLPALLDAFAAMPAELSTKFPLVLVGAKGWRSALLERRVHRLVEQGMIRRLGYLPEAELPAIYAGARAFCLPSVYEGFGLPALEAMSSGTPVIVGENTTMAEFGGEALRTVEVRDPDSIRCALQQLLVDEVEREDLKKKGLAVASRLTWERCSLRHAALYRRVLEGQGYRLDNLGSFAPN